MKKLQDFPAIVAAQATFQAVQEKQAQDCAALRENEAQRLAIIAARQGKTAGAVAMLLDDDTAPLSELERQWQIIEERQRLIAKALHESRGQLDREIAHASSEVCDEERPTINRIIKKNLEILDEIVANNEKLISWREGVEARGFKTSSIPICVVANMTHTRDRYRAWIQQDFPHLKV